MDKNMKTNKKTNYVRPLLEELQSTIEKAIFHLIRGYETNNKEISFLKTKIIKK